MQRKQRNKEKNMLKQTMLSCPPRSHTLNLMFLYSTTSILNPIAIIKNRTKNNSEPRSKRESERERQKERKQTWCGCQHFSAVKFIKDCCLSCSVKSQDQHTSFLLAEQASPQSRKKVSHDEMHTSTKK